MKIGTKSVLFGAHCFFVHPLFVAAAWWQLYGFPRDLRLWIAFFVHDLGYIGKPNMDGPEGEAHVEWGARLMGQLFGPEWGDFCRYHSRFYARRDGRQYSMLCVADKLSVALEPPWFYLLRVRASGELAEYMALAGGKNGSKYAGEPNSPAVAQDVRSDDPRVWFRGMSTYCRAWALAHQGGAIDTWTPSKEAQ